MTSRLFRHALRVALLAAVLTVPAHARQIRVNVASDTFSPDNLTVNLADHVVWIWTGGTHDVTSGNPSTGIPDSRFGSGASASSRTFSWKAAGTLGAQQYFCSIHLPGMAGTLTMVNNGSGAAGSDFRITEVLYNPTSGPDQVEITNFGATGDLSKYRLKINGVSTLSLQIGASGPTSIAMSVPAGGRVVITLGAAGTNTATALFYSSAVNQLTNSGSLALYVPNTQSPALTDASQIIDYVSWNGGNENEATAVSAGLWFTGTSVPDAAQGHSLEFCGIAGQHGPSFWSEVSSPNLGTNGNCSTPLVRSTWGRVKSLYR